MADGTYALDIQELLGAVFNDFQDLLPETLHQSLGKHRPDALDQPRPQVFGHALQRVGRRCAQGLSLELLPVITVDSPSSFSFKPFSCLDGGSGAHYGNEILVTTDLDAQHTEPGFTALERDPFNKSADVLYGRVGSAGLCVGRHV